MPEENIENIVKGELEGKPESKAPNRKMGPTKKLGAIIFLSYLVGHFVNSFLGIVILAGAIAGFIIAIVLRRRAKPEPGPLAAGEGKVIDAVATTTEPPKNEKGKRFRAIGFQGNLVKAVDELDVIKVGEKLKEIRTGKEFRIIKPFVIYEDLKGKLEKVYLVDLNNGETISLQQGGSVTALNTTPTLTANALESNLISQSFRLRPQRLKMFILALAGIAFGYIMASAFR